MSIEQQASLTMPEQQWLFWHAAALASSLGKTRAKTPFQIQTA